VNNAGIVDLWPLGETSDEDLLRIFDVNVFGTHRVTRAMLPLLMGSHGRIVTISSISGLGTSSRIGSYSMTKHAIETWSEVMGRHLEGYGVKVSVIEPGGYRSNISRSAAEVLGRRTSSKSAFLMQREGAYWERILDAELREVDNAPSPEPVAEAVHHALSSESPRPRYLVTSDEEELLWALEDLVWRTVLANRGATFSLTREGLHPLLDKAWQRTGGL
jgi:NAD(P)-dependent dehydrogenase (short-subunit alcohol dehydrogenase family)